MSVTAKPLHVRDSESRNAAIMAEFEEPEALVGKFRELVVAFNGGVEPTQEERSAKALIRHLEHASSWCSHCQRVFEYGDVVHRKRGRRTFGEASWALKAICDDCVREKMHPSWWEHRHAPVLCAGGCGVSVSHWYYRAITTCSTRCTKRAAEARQRVQRDEHICRQCGETYLPARVDAHYCSSACRQRAYRERKAVA